MRRQEASPHQTPDLLASVPREKYVFVFKPSGHGNLVQQPERRPWGPLKPEVGSRLSVLSSVLGGLRGPGGGLEKQGRRGRQPTEGVRRSVGVGLSRSPGRTDMGYIRAAFATVIPFFACR